MRSEADRDRVCEAFAQTPWHSAQLAYFQTILEAARKGDVVLLCWCAPKRCHADVIKQRLEYELLTSK